MSLKNCSLKARFTGSRCPIRNKVHFRVLKEHDVLLRNVQCSQLSTIGRLTPQQWNIWKNSPLERHEKVGSFELSYFFGVLIPIRRLGVNRFVS